MRDLKKIADKLNAYAEMYREPPYGLEVEGTPELLELAATALAEADRSISKLKEQYCKGMRVVRLDRGPGTDYGALCPVCGHEMEEDSEGMKPTHCPACGTKLLYRSDGSRNLKK